MLDHIPILLAEDDKNDIFLMRRAFDRARYLNPLCIVQNGREVVDYLEGAGQFSQREKYPLPGLLLLDLKMPWMDGFDVLAWLHNRPCKEKLPVIVLTSSNQEKDIRQAREMGAEEYRVKPQQFEELIQIVKEVRDRWLNSERKGHSGK